MIQQVRCEPAVEWLAREIEWVRTDTRTDRSLARGVSAVLEKMLARDRDWLWPEHCEPSPLDYRQHVLYVAPDGAFSIVSLVWQPGQKTCIHDHVCWCVVGVYQGTEVESSFDLHEDAAGNFLVPTSSRIIKGGQTSVLVPPDEEIHQVRCAGRESAISIHVYGTDISTRGTSINHRFDPLPVRPNPPGSPRASWRALAG